MNAHLPTPKSTGRLVSEEIWRDLCSIRKNAPLVHNITNYVVMNLTANALLALGASPVMAHAIDEVEEMTALAGSLVINIGTLSGPWIEAMRISMRAAKTKGIPIILDPVGSGATRFRTSTVHALLEAVSPTVIRGNASEIRSIALAREKTKGVDTQRSADEALETARSISRQFGCVVSISGETDLIVDAERVVRIHNGHAFMPRVTGLGCTSTAVTAAFCAVNPSAWHAAAHAMAVMGIAGELAAEKSSGPGSFQPHFLDQLYTLDLAALASRLRQSEGQPHS